MRRGAFLAAAGVAAAALAGCDYDDADLTTKCAGNLDFRAVDASGTHAVVVAVPSDIAFQAVGADEDVTATLDLSTVEFQIGHDLDEVELEPESSYCPDLGGVLPDPVIDQALTATGGTATVTLHHAVHIGSVTGDLTLENLTFSDGETTVSALSMADVPIGRYS